MISISSFDALPVFYESNAFPLFAIQKINVKLSSPDPAETKPQAVQPPAVQPQAVQPPAVQPPNPPQQPAPAQPGNPKGLSLIVATWKAGLFLG